MLCKFNIRVSDKNGKCRDTASAQIIHLLDQNKKPAPVQYSKNPTRQEKERRPRETVRLGFITSKSK